MGKTVTFLLLFHYTIAGSAQQPEWLKRVYLPFGSGISIDPKQKVQPVGSAYTSSVEYRFTGIKGGFLRASYCQMKNKCKTLENDFSNVYNGSSLLTTYTAGFGYRQMLKKINLTAVFQQGVFKTQVQNIEVYNGLYLIRQKSRAKVGAQLIAGLEYRLYENNALTIEFNKLFMTDNFHGSKYGAGRLAMQVGYATTVF